MKNATVSNRGHISFRIVLDDAPSYPPKLLVGIALSWSLGPFQMSADNDGLRM